MSESSSLSSSSFTSSTSQPSPSQPTKLYEDPHLPPPHTHLHHNHIASLIVLQGRQWYIGLILGFFFGIFGWCCFCCIQPQSKTIVIVQAPYGQPAYGQFVQPSPNA